VGGLGTAPIANSDPQEFQDLQAAINQSINQVFLDSACPHLENDDDDD